MSHHAQWRVGASPAWLLAGLLAACGARSPDRVDCAGRLMPDGADPRSARLIWERPEFRSNGAPLTDLAGYRIYAGGDPSQLRPVAELCSPETTTWVVGGLSPGTWFFAVTAVDQGGIENDPTSAVSKHID